MGKEYDLIVLGSGPGGYVSAIRASQLGLKAAVIEKDKPGGVCLNIGCIPSKSLIHQAENFNIIKNAGEFGLEVDTSKLDFTKVHKKSRLAAEKLSKGIQFLLKKNNIDYIEGTGEFISQSEISVNKKDNYKANNFIIATGSRPKSLPSFPIDENDILSSTGALMMDKLPESIVILGAGAIGIEFSFILNSFGVEVHLVEFLDQILPIEDSETAKLLSNTFKKKGIKIYTSTKAESFTKENDKLIVKLEKKNGEKIEVQTSKILSAVGRIPNSEDIGLDKAGVELDEKGCIKTGNYYQTANPKIYAIGDIINTPQLAHVASKEGEIAVEHIAGHRPIEKIDNNTVPSAVYSNPEIASFGYSEHRAESENISFKTFSFPYKGAGKSVAINKPEGFVKILFDPKTQEILGGHIIGYNATELIHEVLLAKNAELLPEDIANMIHAHPTISEAVMESFKGIYDKPIHG